MCIRDRHLTMSHCADSTCPSPIVQTALAPVPLCRQHLFLSHCADNTCSCPIVQTALDPVPLCRQHLSLPPCWWNHSMAQETVISVVCVKQYHHSSGGFPAQFGFSSPSASLHSAKRRKEEKNWVPQRTMSGAPQTAYFPILNWAEQITHFFPFLSGHQEPRLLLSKQKQAIYLPTHPTINPIKHLHRNSLFISTHT